jgi:hypothetical protein
MRKFFETSETFGIEKGKGSKKKPTRGKSFGYQILGFGSGGVAPKFVVATGGSVSTCGNFKVHQFTSSGTFEITCAGDARGSSSFTVGAGGGPGGGNCGNGQSGGTGSNSVAFPITSNGGGGGGSHPSGGGATPGGNGGGQGRPNSPGPKSAAPGNNPPTSPPQGVPGSSVTGGGVTGNPGGTTSNITFSNVTRTTGGTRFQGGASGTGNTGNGGGGGNNTAGDAGGGGGSGIVIIRYKFK